jgi:hypothetical protein
VVPNFHFAHMAPGLVWTTADATLEEYVGYWCEQIESTGAVPRAKMGRVLARSHSATVRPNRRKDSV